jgi:hypothetical protein
VVICRDEHSAEHRSYGSFKSPANVRRRGGGCDGDGRRDLQPGRRGHQEAVEKKRVDKSVHVVYHGVADVDTLHDLALVDLQ